MNILGIGEVVLDKTNILSGFPKDGEKMHATDTQYSVGGPVPAALILLSRLGCQCTLVCSLGEDWAGTYIQNYLEKEKINLTIQPQSQTKTNMVMVNEQTGSRTIIKDSIHHQPLKNINKQLIVGADMILFDRHEPEAFKEVMRIKKPKNQIMIDPSTEISDKTLHMIQSADYPVIPIETLHHFDERRSWKQNLAELYHQAKKPIIVTAGAWGSLYYDGGNICSVPAYDVPVVDTLGAGDVYRGALAYGMLRQWQLEKALRFANKVAALQCTKKGNGTAIPTLEEIRAFNGTEKIIGDICNHNL